MVVIFVTEPPSAPQNLTVNFVDQSTVILSWNTPSFLGGRLDVVYRVECDACGPSVVYSPNTVCLIIMKFNTFSIELYEMVLVSSSVYKHYHQGSFPG